jgi:hypothetical protein
MRILSYLEEIDFSEHTRFLGADNFDNRADLDSIDARGAGTCAKMAISANLIECIIPPPQIVPDLLVFLERFGYWSSPIFIQRVA